MVTKGQSGASILILVAILAFPGFLFAQEQTPSPPPGGKRGAEAGDALVTFVWNGVQQAQKKYSSGCGAVTETRTSQLLAKPLVLRGKFCGDGMTKFALEYFEPQPLRVRFNEDYLNVSTGPGARSTEVIQVGRHVRRTQAFFSRDTSIGNLRQHFVITVRESGPTYEMRLAPRSERFKSRVHYVVVKLGKDDFLLRSLEVDGKNGVNSVFAIQINGLNLKLGEELFQVYKP